MYYYTLYQTITYATNFIKSFNFIVKFKLALILIIIKFYRCNVDYQNFSFFIRITIKLIELIEKIKIIIKSAEFRQILIRFINPANFIISAIYARLVILNFIETFQICRCSLFFIDSYYKISQSYLQSYQRKLNIVYIYSINI